MSAQLPQHHLSAAHLVRFVLLLDVRVPSAKALLSESHGTAARNKVHTLMSMIASPQALDVDPLAPQVDPTIEMPPQQRRGQQRNGATALGFSTLCSNFPPNFDPLFGPMSRTLSEEPIHAYNAQKD